MSRKILSVAALLASVVALSLAACSGGSDEPTATQSQSPSPTAMAGTPTTGAATATSQPSGEAPVPKNPKGNLVVAVFDVAPGVGLGSAQAPVESMQYWGVGEGLFAVDADQNVIGKLATEWTVADDQSYVDIKLRQDVVFQKDFGPFTADDVVFTLNDANANTNPTSIHGQAGDFAALFGEAQKIDQYTVRLPFESFDLRWNGNFLNEQAQGTAYFSKNAYDTKGEDWMKENIVSTGPFQVDQWKQDDRAVLSKVPYDHWFKNPAVDGITFLEVPEPASRVAMLKSGDADIGLDISIKDIKGLTNSGFTAQNITRRGFVESIIYDGNYWEDHSAKTGDPIDWGGTYQNDLPWQGKPGDQADLDEAKAVRQALSYAIDRDLIGQTILDGFYDLGSTEYVDTTASYYKPAWDNPYDTAKAKELMSSTIWPTGKFPIGLWVGGEAGGGTGTNGEITDAIAGMWQAVWPDIDVQVFKSAYSIIRPSLVGRTNSIPYVGDCDEGATTIPFDWPHGLTETSLTRGGYGCGIEIPKIAETYLAVNKESDPTKRVQLNTDLIDYLHDQQLITGVVQIPVLVIYNPKSIASWEGTPSIFASADEFENIVPASR